MPQKKNPDVAELMRGKSGRIFGSLLAVLTVMKGLPLAYQSDLQEDKEPLFDAADTALATLRTLAAMLPGLRFDAERMRQEILDEVVDQRRQELDDRLGVGIDRSILRQRNIPVARSGEGSVCGDETGLER